MKIEALLVKLVKTGSISLLEKAGLRTSLEWLVWIDSMSHKQNKMLSQLLPQVVLCVQAVF